ncbi:peptidase S8/S53 domain-containing protein [Fennellomyces sp. T-0311]|nr:peptidase S8/S53 domain-containing protein [Fennellomyces sp. T-0311]
MYTHYWLIAALICLVLPSTIVLGRHIDHPSPQRFTVQFRSPPGNHRAVQEEQDKFLNYLEQHGVNISVRYRYNDIMNGMSIYLDDSSLLTGVRAASANMTSDHETDTIHPTMFLAQTLSTCPYVHRYWPGKRYARPVVRRSSRHFAGSKIDAGLANLQVAHEMTTVDQVRQLGWNGKGIKVGVLDTGIDYTHPALGGCFGDGCLVAYGSDLVGDNYGEQNMTIDPDNDPIDHCDGHGTHIAGIIAANDTVKGFQGVSPNVILGAWRIFGCDGDADDDIILMAAEEAVKAGMDIINLSLGGSTGSWEEDALAVALSNIADRDVLVVVAQGNEGRDGFERTPSPAIGRHVLSVASIDNGKKLGYGFSLISSGSNETIDTYDYVPSDGKEQFAMNGTMFPIITLNSNTTSGHRTASTGCDPIQHDLNGYVALLRRGECEFGQKAMQVQNAGAVGLIVYCEPGEDAVAIDLDDYTRIKIPVGSISGDDGIQLVDQLANRTDIVIGFSEQLVKVPTARLSSVFSTWGPDPELHLKPEIAGVGGIVYSTYPTNLGSYTMLSGTSMAAPYVTGSIALYMQATGRKDRATIFNAFMNTASLIQTSHDPNSSQIQSPIKQGAGLVQVYDAILNNVTMDPPKIALNDSAHFKEKTTLTIHNHSPDTQKFTLTHIPAAAINGFDFSTSSVPLSTPKYVSASANVTFEKTEFEIKGNGNTTVEVHFTPPDDSTPHLLYGGYIQLNSTSTSNHASVPYFGSLGNQRDLNVFEVDYDFPCIGDYYGDPITDPTYNFTDGDTLYLFVRYASATRLFKTELLSASNGTVVGELAGVHDIYVPRNDGTIENFNDYYKWTGSLKVLSSGRSRVSYPKARPGKYRLRLLALRMLGDKSVEEDWDTWESEEFTIVQ